MRLYFHILRTHIAPLIFSFVTLMFIFLLQFLMKAVDQLIGKGLGVWVIVELIALSLAWMVVLAAPMSVLVATLMAFGRLSAQHEITAMKASGISLYRMLGLVVLCAGILTYGLIQFNNKVLPEANHRFKTLMIDIRRTKPTLTIEQGVFSQDLQGYSILARKTYQYSNDLEGVTIYDYTDPAENVVVTAERGRVTFTPDYRKLIMDLQNGEIHQLGTADLQAYRRMRFAKHRIVMNAEGFEFERSSEGAFSRGDREMSAQLMQIYVDSLEALNDSARRQAITVDDRRAMSRIPPGPAKSPATLEQVHKDAVSLALTASRAALNMIDNQLLVISYNREEINKYLVEINKKYSIPFACVVFVFIGAPLGIMARRGTFGVAASLSLGFFLLYWASLIGGEKLGDRGFITPWLGMWMANIVLSLVGLYLTLRMGRDTLSINWLSLRRIIPAFLRSPDSPAIEGDRLP
ncbi:MAG TPA: LptF/LptG family permease [Bacteroidota bacterium]|jgi:lipopolysaccharide export system permease protein|nr:LptF/LptG family permease [Bacteroidota bacterium]